MLIDDEYRSLQSALVEMPHTGDLIQGSGGIRRVLRKNGGRGKRGGIRVIYYWATYYDQTFMLYTYAKNESDNLTKDQLSTLKKAVTPEFKL